MAGAYERDGPSQEMFEMYLQLDKTGLRCGVHDPDFSDPLEGTLHLERGLRHSLRLECEDESLNFTRAITHLVFESRDNVRDGRGLALVDQTAGGGATPGGSAAAAATDGLHILVLDSYEDRETLLHTLDMLRDEPRAFRSRKKKMMLGCLPKPSCGAAAAGCVTLPKRARGMVHRRRRRRKSQDGEALTLTGSIDNHLPKDGGTIAFPTLPDRGPPLPGMESVKAFVKREFDKALTMKNKRSGMNVTGFLGRGTNAAAKGTSGGAAAAAAAGPSSGGSGGAAGAAGAGAGSFGGASGGGPNGGVERNSIGRGSMSMLDQDRAGSLLVRLFGLNEARDLAETSSFLSATSSLPQEGAPLPHGNGERWPKNAGELFSAVAPTGLVSFPAFWAVLEDLLMVQQLWDQPGLQKYLKEGSSPGTINLGNWRWFLVQVQDEAREIVESAEEQLKKLGLPDVDDHAQLTMYGLSRFLSSYSNTFFEPRRCRQHCEMNRPLSEYWISTAHHVHGDLGGALARRSKLGATSDEETTSGGASSHNTEPKSSLEAALSSGCRVLSLALDVAQEGRGSGQLVVLLQQDRILLPEALQIIDTYAFRATTMPLLLVLHLGRLTAGQSALVPEHLRNGLGNRLFKTASLEESQGLSKRGSISLGAAALPTPVDAQEKIVVVLAPNIPNWDPSLDPDPAPSLRDPSSPSAGFGLAPETDPFAALEAWETAAKEFLVWPGRCLDSQFPHQLLMEVAVNFLPCDELQRLEKGKSQQMLEYHRQYLTLAFPVATRAVPANFNVALAWSSGVQAAAICSTTTGSAAAADASGGPVLAHIGRFCQDNGGCGYILKPPHMRSEAHVSRQASDLACSEPESLRLDVRLLAARGLPQVHEGSNGPVSAVVSIWGASGDCSRQVYRASRPSLTGLVTWSESHPSVDGSMPKPMSFLITEPAAAIFVLELLETDMVLGGAQRVAFFAAPCDGLRTGLRWIPLWTLSSMGDPRPTHFGPLSGVLVQATIRTDPRRQ